MSEELSYSVPGMHCEHCRRAVTEEVAGVRGVESVDVDLASKTVTIRGRGLDEAALRTAIAEAGYEVAA